MFQNDGEMFDLEYAGEARYYNGHLEVASSVSPKKESKIKKRKVMSNRDDVYEFSPAEGKHQFSDKLKALLKTGAAVNENGIDADDPYTFSEPEPQVLRLHQTATPINTYSRRCITLSSKFGQIIAKKSGKNMFNSAYEKNSRLDNMGHDIKMQPVVVGHPVASQPPVIPFFADSSVVSDFKASDDESSKTMNRLQAKIARKKVIGKHKKSTHVNDWGEELLQAKPPSFTRDRSLLEEQLLGVKQEAVVVKKEPKSPPASSPKSPRQSARATQNSLPALMVITVPPKRKCKVECRQTVGTRHEALQRIRQLQSSLQDHKHDLFPLGLEASESEDSDVEDALIYQRHWFSTWDQPGTVGEGQRGAKLCSMKGELRRKLCQLSAAMAHRPEDKLARVLVDAAQAQPAHVANFLNESRGRRYHIPGTTYNRSKQTMLRKRRCCYRQSEKDACTNIALPCTQHCMRHIMYNVNQLLYEHCTAKFSDNTQCCIPVFDICHELPLCLEHARKRDNYDKMCAETKPKRVRKKAKPSAMTRPSKRGKKKRKSQRPSDPPPPSLSLSLHEEVSRVATSGFTSDAEDGHFTSSEPVVSAIPTDVTVRNEIGTSSSSCPVESSEHMLDKVDHHSTTSLYSEMNIKEEPYSEITIKEEHIDVNEVEGIAYPLDPDLGHQATNLLEEHDLTNVLNQIPADAFNDLFTEDKNGEYEPTREETEELERALEAVDKDVKSLEKLSQSQGLLDTLIDEQTLVQTLAQLPEVPSLSVSGGVVPVFATYHNGFVLNSHDVASSAQIKNFVQHPMDVAPTISIQTQTDMPS